MNKYEISNQSVVSLMDKFVPQINSAVIDQVERPVINNIADKFKERFNEYFLNFYTGVENHRDPSFVNLNIQVLSTMRSQNVKDKNYEPK